MKLKPFTPENGKIGFLASKRFIEVVLFLMLAIQLFQEFYEIKYLTYITVALSYSGAGVFLLASYASMWHQYLKKTYTTICWKLLIFTVFFLAVYSYL